MRRELRYQGYGTGMIKKSFRYAKKQLFSLFSPAQQGVYLVQQQGKDENRARRFVRAQSLPPREGG